MKTLFILFTLLFSLSSMGAIVGNQTGALCETCIDFDGTIIDTSNSNIKKLHATTSAAGYWDTARIMVEATDPRAGATYMPQYITASDTIAIVLGVNIDSDSGASTVGVQLSYGDASREMTTTTPAGTVYCGGGTSSLMGIFTPRLLLENGRRKFTTCQLLVVPDKYITMQGGPASVVSMEIYIGECPSTGACEFRK